ncbi:hypothetical protein MKW92_010717 [Papaver armeniacum]|nr:hypothetical protein MKW92_010717 [Papaver armeniacum]
MFEEEVEMEDIVEEPILDIDSCDSKNTLAVHCESPNYMVQQSDINEKMMLMDETLFLMVNIIDRFLARQKWSERNLIVPVVDDLILICDKAYTRKEVLAMLELLSFFLIELSLVDHDMLRFLLSMLAAAAIYTAQCTLNRTRHWSRPQCGIQITQKINYSK